MPLQHWLASVYVGLEWMSLGVGVLIALSAIDDVLIDVWYWWLRAQRALMHRRGTINPLTADQLRQRPEQPIAIMVPAWKEYDVIAQMIASMVATLDYKNYVIFVGTYCNDPATAQEVDRMRRRYKQLRRVEVPNPGPTCKADCLNWVVQAIFLYEREHHMTFVGTVLHDSEDVLHPLELKFYNYLLPRKDLIQLPVMSLERHWYELVAGTYMDEFAESHGKDMLVREHSAGVVPSAGVGTCFSRRAMQALCEETQNQPFNTASLTEDYDIGNRLAHMGMRSVFAVFPVEYQVRPLHDANATLQTRVLPLGVREFFPDTFVTAYRQKSRWTLGIGLQSWEQIRFSGNWASRYLLLRDRKGVFTAFVSMGAYGVLLGFMAFHVLASAGLWTVYYPSAFELRPWSEGLLYVNILSLVNRLGHRYYFVSRLYGWRQGLWSFPRMVVGNFVNFMAVARAWRLFFAYLFKGQRMVWDKTMHDFPSAETLANQKQRIGELLLSWQAVDQTQLDEAVHAHESTGLPLGRLMVMKGWLDDDTLAEAIAYQCHLPRGVARVDDVLKHAYFLPLEVCVRLRVLPLGLDEGGHPLLAVAGPLCNPELDCLATHLKSAPLLRVVRESEIVDGLRALTAHLGTVPSLDRASQVPLLGDLLISQGHLSKPAFDEAMARYKPNLNGRLGAFLVASGVIERSAIDAVLVRQRGDARIPRGPLLPQEIACV